MRKLIILLTMALAINCLPAQDTIFINGTTKVNFTLKSPTPFYVVNCTRYSTSSNTTTTPRTITNVGKLLFKTNGTGTFQPNSATYQGVWEYYVESCGLKPRTITVMPKPTIIVPPPVITPPTGFSYTWKGAIGNTSSTDYGPSKIKALRAPTGLCEFNGFMYFSTGFTEGNSPMFKVSLSDLTKRIEVSKPLNNDFVFEGVDIKAYGDRLYLLGFDPSGYKDNNGYSSRISSGIVVYNTSDAEVAMQYGQSVKCTYQDNAYKSVIGLIKNDTSFHPKSLEVDANYLYVYTSNLVVKYDRLTGQFISSNTYTPPTTIANFTRNGITLTMSRTNVSYNGKPICYPQTSPKVDNYTYNFRDLNHNKIKGSVTIGSDGSFWVVDAGNCRILHYSSSGIYLNQVAFIPMNYNCSVDANDPTRVFAGPLEYTITYPSLIWELVNNWSYGLNPAYLPIPGQYENTMGFLRNVVTVNGKTYGVVDSINSDGWRFPTRLILTPTGAKTLKRYEAFQNVYLGTDGNEYILSFEQVLGKQSILYKNGAQLDKTPVITTKSASYLGSVGFVYKDTSIYLLNFDKNVAGSYHLERIRNGSYIWQRAIGAPSPNRFPTGDTFPTYDGGGRAASSKASVCNNVVAFLYTGEGYQGQQTTKLYLYKNGKHIKTLGKTYIEACLASGTDETPKEYAGNAFAGDLVCVNGIYYYYFNDEHGGALQCFIISGI